MTEIQSLRVVVLLFWFRFLGKFCLLNLLYLFFTVLVLGFFVGFFGVNLLLTALLILINFYICTSIYIKILLQREAKTIFRQIFLFYFSWVNCCSNQPYVPTIFFCNFWKSSINLIIEVFNLGTKIYCIPFN